LGENDLEKMVIFRLSKNTLVWVRILPRLGENTLESTFAPGAFSPRRLYPHLGETTLSPRRGTTRLAKTVQRIYLHLKTILAWANYVENTTYQTIYAGFTTTVLLHMSQMTNLTRNSTCISSISTYSSCIPE